MPRIVTFIVVGIMICCSGCVTIPPEAPELSAELGKRLNAIEESHIALVHRLMDEKRRRVDDFILREWLPVFAEEVFREPAINNAWQMVVAEDNPEQRLRFLMMLGPKLQATVNEKRLELIKPLDELELDIERRLRQEYALATSINNSITSYLASASAVAENRDRLLDMAGVDRSAITEAIDDADKAVTTLVKGKDQLEDRVNGFLKVVEAAKETLGNK